MSFTSVRGHTWLTEQDCDLDTFRTLVGRTTDRAGFPHASAVQGNVLVYDSERLRAPGTGRAVRAELVRALSDGPGVVVFRDAFPDPTVVDRTTAVFDAIIAEQHASSATAGDHFARPGANDRVWNALEKVALRDPEAFADYYANDILALASRAWLGSDPPVDGLAPPAQSDVVRRALREEWTPRALRDELRAGAARRTS